MHKFIFTRQNYGFILDHCPENDPVIPFVCVVDSFLCVLREHFGVICVLKDVQIVKGFVLPDFDEISVFVKIDEETSTCIMEDETGKARYKASFSKESPCPPSYTPFQGEFAPPDYSFLFHGPMLHTIESYRWHENEAESFLKSACLMNWEKKEWVLDPAIGDGALQLGCLVAGHIKGKTSLPVKIGRCEIWGPTPKERVPCKIKIKEINALRYIYDAECYGHCGLYDIHAYFRSVKSI